MIEAMYNSSSVGRLVNLLKRDIITRGLHPGERYLTNVEVCELHGVSSTTADRAMRQLANENILVRQRGNGSYVGPAVTLPDNLKKMNKIVLLQPDDGELTFLNRFIHRHNRSLSNIELQVNIVSSSRTREHIIDLLDDLKNHTDVKAVIAVSFQNNIYQLFSRMSLPLFVVGSMEDNRMNIPYVDIDYKGGGKLLAEYFFERGHRKIGAILGAQNRVGTYHFCDGVVEGLTAHNLPANAVAFRFHDRDRQTFEAHLRNLFSQDNPPTALITQGELPAKDTLMLIQKNGFADINENAIGYASTFEQEHSPFVSALPVDDIVDYTLRLLENFDNHKTEFTRGYPHIIPVHLKYPHKG